MFKLSTTLAGHEQDVRDVVAASNDLIISALRDATARVWHPTESDNGWSSPILPESIIAFQSSTNAFINAVTYIPNDTEPLLAAAGKEAIIYLTLPQDNFVKPGDDFGKYQLVGHAGNICSLSYKDGYIISSSWDSTAKVWDINLFELKFDLKGHDMSVWDSKIIDSSSNTFLTCGADRTIRKWVGDKQVGEFVGGHNDVIRKLLILPGNKTFASASNDCTIKIWDLDSGKVLHTLSGHESFVYDLGILSNGDIVSCGEDRTVRIWRDFKVLQAITLPCISVWCLSVLPNDDIVVGGSDKKLRVFTRSSQRYAPEYQIADFTESVQESSISEQSVDDLKKTDLPGYDALKNPGKEEGSVIMVKNPSGIIEAQQWSGGEWVKIGDVVGSAGGSTGDKVEHLGKKYDYVFDVDVEDGKPPLKLPYNSNESTYTAAERFLAENELPSRYLEEVVQFIEKNTAGMQLDQQQNTGNTVDPYADSQQRKQTTSPSLLPQKKLISFKEFKPEQLIKGLIKFNNEQHTSKFSESEISQIQLNLLDLNSKQAIEIITLYLPNIIDKWDLSRLLIGYDLLRVSIPRVTTADLIRSTDAAETILKSINHGLRAIDSKDVTSLPLYMMLLKTLNNLIGNTLFIQLYITVDDDTGNLYFSELFDELLVKLTSLTTEFSVSSGIKESKHYSTTITALSTFIFNLSVFPFINTSFRTNANGNKPVIDFANKLADILIESNGESAYRLCIAFGNYYFLKVVSLPSWIEKVKQLYGDEQRFIDLDIDIKKV